MTEKEKPVYKKIVSQKTASGDIVKQTTITLSPWEISDFSGNEKSGHTCQVRVLKLTGKTPRNSYINFDPADEEIKQTIKEMYLAYEKVKKGA